MWYYWIVTRYMSQGILLPVWTFSLLMVNHWLILLQKISLNKTFLFQSILLHLTSSFCSKYYFSAYSATYWTSLHHLLQIWNIERYKLTIDQWIHQSPDYQTCVSVNWNWSKLSCVKSIWILNLIKGILLNIWTWWWQTLLVQPSPGDLAISTMPQTAQNIQVTLVNHTDPSINN